MPNPIDEMTEEQKEYEAMKLVNMLDKLSRYCIPVHFCLVSKVFYFFVSLTESYLEQRLWHPCDGTGGPGSRSADPLGYHGFLRVPVHS